MGLKNKSKEDSGVLLEQYKLAVTMADKVSDRRGITNNFFIALNSAIASVGSLTKEYVLIFIVGILFCFLWLSILKSYKRLNKVKFDIINKLENDLPINLMQHEWKLLNKNNHEIFSYYESYIPIIFILVYVSCIIIKYLPCIKLFIECLKKASSIQ
ncbi:hypothetical protein BKN38_04615 [Helicobacter sp. CLO-3]|uniref:RipA family octameric membrane protein n=1 Tax=unclassified Helicobacter TaxID=2593540 RepID=UPI0008050D88|nr:MULTISPECIES: hypothetical protein [unclassified Helicobacter]OBV29822.1 hypothetical protein BA723_04110 [Helicobacter sp. CLO-3]OHU83972.1 hypothetical protein BKN38_04615 [Helicobacter sp. CLO-3]